MSESYDADEHVKEVYARFGRALYFAQVLEHGLVNALVVSDLIPRKRRAARNVDEWSQMVDGFMSRHFEGTMGRLLQALKAVTPVPAELDSLLTDALRRRNWLAHDFFRERAEALMTRSGRDDILRELSECETTLRNADERLDDTIRPLRERAGMTDAIIAKAYEDMVAALPRDG